MKLPFTEQNEWRWRWLQPSPPSAPLGANPVDNKLHRIKSGKKEDYWLDSGVSVCGLESTRFFVPGIFDRLNAPRCDLCCNLLGILSGSGAPFNSAISEPEELPEQTGPGA